MTPQEKAKQLFEAYLNVGMGDGWAKECALIAYNEILKNGLFTFSDKEYWIEVKREIEKL